MGYRFSKALLFGIILFGLANTAQAQTASFREYGAPPSEILQLPIMTMGNNVAYVSLLDLIQNIGGATTLTPNRMRIDLNSTTAWVGLNDNRVNALSIFTLNNNIIANNEGVYIAVSDCQNFFKRSFRLNMGVNVLDTIRTPRANPTMPESELAPELFEPTRSIPSQPGSINQTPEPATPQRSRSIQTILIEAGHGGFEHGVEGPSGSLEKNVTLRVAQLVNELLGDSTQPTVKLVRESDSELSIEQRAVIAQSSRSDLLISLHVGGSFSPDTVGIAAFYPEQGSQQSAKGLSLRWHASSIATTSRNAAEIIMASIEAEMGITSRGIHSIPNPLFSAINGPAVLIELGCLTNAEEETKLTSPDYQEKLADAIAKAIQQVTTESNKPEAISELTNDSIIEP